MTDRPGPGLSVGDEVEVDVTAIAHGGHAVARHEGQVLFVRHAVPGERVRARVTEAGARQRFLRADAVGVVSPSPDRVEPPCPYAGPGRCGGCDLQHVALDRQRALKAEVVSEQLRRLAGLDLPVTAEPVPGDEAGLRWRTRTEFAVDEAGRAGLRRHRSHEVLPVEDCLISSDQVVGTGVLQRDWGERPGVDAVDVVAPSVGDPVVVTVPAAEVGTIRERVVAEWPQAGSRRGLDREFTLSARGFWQVHPGAAETFLATAMAMLDVRPGERALDLYAGVGLFAAALAEAVGPSGQVVAVEADTEATRHAEANLAAYGTCVVVRARVDDAFGVPRRERRRGARGRRTPARSPLLPPSADVVVLDPPRTGAGPDVCRAVAALRPRAVAYVACDPAALARDLATLLDSGYRLEGLRAFDAFPMTHHVECIAHLVRE